MRRRGTDGVRDQNRNEAGAAPRGRRSLRGRGAKDTASRDIPEGRRDKAEVQRRLTEAEGAGNQGHGAVGVDEGKAADQQPDSLPLTGR